LKRASPATVGLSCSPG